MSLKNRYQFYKKVYPEYLLLFWKKDEWVSHGLDNKLWIILKKEDEIKKRKTNYIMIENMRMVKKQCFKENQYLKYKRITQIVLAKKVTLR